MKARKILVMVMALALTAALAVGGTLAYLTAQDTVTNTFTVGNVQIKLDEAKANPDGSLVANADRVQANSYKLLPGHTYNKDPQIHVDANSENCWLFVKVENGIAAIEDSSNTIAAQMTAKGWTAVSGTTNIYAYGSIVAGGTSVDVFDSFKINGAVIGGEKPTTPVEGALYLADYANAQIVVTAYAIQADGFEDAADAWAHF